MRRKVEAYVPGVRTWEGYFAARETTVVPCIARAEILRHGCIFVCSLAKGCAPHKYACVHAFVWIASETCAIVQYTIGRLLYSNSTELFEHTAR